VLGGRFAWSRLGSDGRRANELVEVPGAAQYLLDIKSTDRYDGWVKFFDLGIDYRTRCRLCSGS
jgi:hypothetical protein